MALDSPAGKDYFEAISSEEAFNIAKKEGLRIELPAWDELFVDIDTKEGLDWFNNNLNIVNDYVGVESVKRTHSKSGEAGKEHIILKLSQPLGNAIERIALQAILGSDLKREALSYARWKKDDPNPTLFYEKKEGP